MFVEVRMALKRVGVVKGAVEYKCFIMPVSINQFKFAFSCIFRYIPLKASAR